MWGTMSARERLSLVLYCHLLHYRDEVGEATLTVRSLKYVVCCSVDWRGGMLVGGGRL